MQNAAKPTPAVTNFPALSSVMILTSIAANVIIAYSLPFVKKNAFKIRASGCENFRADRHFAAADNPETCQNILSNFCRQYK